MVITEVQEQEGTDQGQGTGARRGSHQISHQAPGCHEQGDAHDPTGEGQEQRVKRRVVGQGAVSPGPMVRLRPFPARRFLAAPI